MKKKNHRGYCSICGRCEELTCDHVPPKGCISVSEVELRNLSQLHQKEEPKHRKILQSGVKFKTICSNCNNTLLGKIYDKELKKISEEISKIAKAKEVLVLPDKSKTRISPQKLARALVGHLLAACISKDTENPPKSAPMYDAMRSFFLNQNQKLDERLEIFYWYYPSKKQVVLRGFGTCLSYPGPFIIGDYLKFFPLAYAIYWDRDKTAKLNLTKLQGLDVVKFDDERDIEINLRQVVSLNWPEYPGDNGIALCANEYTYISMPRKRL